MYVLYAGDELVLVFAGNAAQCHTAQVRAGWTSTESKWITLQTIDRLAVAL